MVSKSSSSSASKALPLSSSSASASASSSAVSSIVAGRSVSRSALFNRDFRRFGEGEGFEAEDDDEGLDADEDEDDLAAEGEVEDDGLAADDDVLAAVDEVLAAEDEVLAAEVDDFLATEGGVLATDDWESGVAIVEVSDSSDLTESKLSTLSVRINGMTGLGRIWADLSTYPTSSVTEWPSSCWCESVTG
jgi:hypothetical protein